MEKSIQQTPESPVRNPEFRRTLAALETYLIENTATFEAVVKHHWSHGTYSREMRLPAGTCATGAEHRYACNNIITKGRAILISDEGERELVAGDIFESGPGVRKAVVVLEDFTIVTVHPWTGPHDVAAVEAALTIPTTPAIPDTRKPLCLSV